MTTETATAAANEYWETIESAARRSFLDYATPDGGFEEDDDDARSDALAEAKMAAWTSDTPEGREYLAADNARRATAAADRKAAHQSETLTCSRCSAEGPRNEMYEVMGGATFCGPCARS